MKKLVNKKRLLVAFIAVISAVCGVALSALAASDRAMAERDNLPFTVVIDAGHGGIDGGVSGTNTGVTESELNLAVAKLLREDFSAAGFRVVMTRTTSAGLYGSAQTSLKKADMKNRKRIIDGCSPDLVISIHMNRYSLPSRRGAQVFYKKGDGQSSLLAESIQLQLNGMEEAARECSALTGDYYILNVSPCPAVIVECGFLSNAEDEALLVTEEYRQRIAYVIFKGAIGYMADASAFLEKTA